MLDNAKILIRVHKLLICAHKIVATKCQICATKYSFLATNYTFEGAIYLYVNLFLCPGLQKCQVTEAPVSFKRCAEAANQKAENIKADIHDSERSSAFLHPLLPRRDWSARGDNE